jgi:hypothetical protein
MEMHNVEIILHSDSMFGEYDLRVVDIDDFDWHGSQLDVCGQEGQRSNNSPELALPDKRLYRCQTSVELKLRGFPRLSRSDLSLRSNLWSELGPKMA